MLWTLIRKEMLANVTSLRFVLTLLLVTAIFVVTGFAFVGRHKQEIKDFSETSNENLSGLEEASENLSKVPSYVQTIRKKPKITQLCCEGFEKSMPNTFKMNAFSIQNPEIVSRSNFLFPRLADIDWAFTISLILSFVAFLMTFDSLSAERERGTLSLIMSNPIPRDKVILGKYISGMLTLMIPLFVGLLLNLIIVSLSGLPGISGGQWTKVLAFVAMSILYLSTFVILGMLVSSRSAKSRSSIVILLFVWVIIVVIIPSAGRIVAERFIKVPARSEVARQIREIHDEIWDNSDRYGEKAGWTDPRLKWYWVNPPGSARLHNAVTDARNRINKEYINKMMAQVSLGRNITRISPTVMYQCASEAIIGTGVVRFRNLYNQLKMYKQTMKDFALSVDKRDPDSYHLWAEDHENLLSQKPVDYNAIPKFEELDAPIGSALKGAVWHIGALALLNLLLFMAIYISFLRSDIKA